MFKPSALVIAGAVFATAGAAHAQDRQAGAHAEPAVPWYQRFTTSGGVTETITGDLENDRQFAPSWTMSQRWGVTLDVREAERLERLPEGGRGDQTSVGAYYQFTPRVRVGGAVSLESAQLPGAAQPLPEDEAMPRAGVRIESAFRF